MAAGALLGIAEEEVLADALAVLLEEGSLVA